MKNLFIAILVILIGGAFFAYKEGYLAGYHPMLDPGNPVETQAENFEEVESTPPKKEESEKSPEKSDLEQKKLIKAREEAEKKAQKEAEREEEKLEMEKRSAERAEKLAAANAERKARAELTSKIKAEISDLLTKSDEIRQQIQSTERKMYDKEIEWRREKIQRSDSEKNELRSASANFIENLKSQIAVIESQIQEKQNQIPK